MSWPSPERIRKYKVAREIVIVIIHPPVGTSRNVRNDHSAYSVPRWRPWKGCFIRHSEYQHILELGVDFDDVQSSFWGRTRIIKQDTDDTEIVCVFTCEIM